MRRNLFTIAPGAPFLRTFVDALLAGKIVSDISRESDSLALSRVTIYVPTQRAARALVAEFAQAFEGGATLLPRILPLGGLEERENAAFFATRFDVSADAALAPPIEELERRLLLSQLILEWSRAMERAIISVDHDGAPTLHPSEPLLVASSPASAYRLAADLGALIDEFIIEDIAPEALKDLSDAPFDQYWAITTKFLDIALKEWPAILSERGWIDAAAREKHLIETQIEGLRHAGPPVIALGSTGTQPTTARLLAAIAARENGAVILPGLDRSMSDAAWARIGMQDSREEPAFTHPQTMLKRLLGIIGAHRHEPQELGRLSDALEARRALLATAMAPAEDTAHWRDYRAASRDRFESALEGVTLLEAPDERLEALTLALFMREALETPNATSALVTPDQNIGRRVAAELRRFNIEIDDSGGKPLALTEIGALARLIAQIGAEGVNAISLAALIAHPLSSFGFSRTRIASLAPKIDIGVLRVFAAATQGFAAKVSAAREGAIGNHAHPAARRISEDDWRAIEEVLARVDAIFSPFATLSNNCALNERALAHCAALQAILAGAEDGETEGASAVFELLDRLSLADAPKGFDAQSYAALFDSVAFENILRGPRNAHPRLKILGPLEARLIDADIILLAGLDEGVWPPQTDTGAFLNRSMRAQLGLSPPERRIGQSAHDVTMAFGARRVILSRAKKRDGGPTVSSRFLARLEALAGDAITPCKARGARMLAIAETLDHPGESKAIARPAPRPPAALRPRKLSVTRIERLRRDPYAIFAETILRLAPLKPLGAEPGAREIGTAIHGAIDAFVKRHPYGPPPESAREELLSIARGRLAIFFDDPQFVSFQWPRLEAGLDHALAFETERRAYAKKIFVETSGAWQTPLSDDSVFTITAIADRVEIDREGNAHVFDYKTGAPPSMKQVKTGWSPQLTLEAAMIEAGAFPDVGAVTVESGAYIALKSAETRWLHDNKASFADMVAKHRDELFKLLNQFRDEKTPYASRPYVAFLREASDYDHLARVQEWMRGGAE